MELLNNREVPKVNEYLGFGGKMRKRKLGESPFEITTVGFGTWVTGGAGWSFSWSKQDDRESLEAIARGLELGINWIDTAAVYGLGHAEEVVAKALKGKRDDVILATKCGLAWDDQGRIGGNLKSESIRKECEDSLRRLNTDIIDLYQIHWPNPDGDIEEGWTEMMKLKEEGKIKYAGASNFNVSQMKRAMKIGKITSLQPPYSMLERGVEKDTLKYCNENDIGVVAYSPLQTGLLTGKFKEDSVENMPDDDWRKTKSPHFKEPLYTTNLEFVEKLKGLAKDAGKTPAQLAVAWVLRRDEVTSAIVGARRPSQIEETAKGDFEIDDKTLSRVEQLLADREEKIKK